MDEDNRRGSTELLKMTDHGQFSVKLSKPGTTKECLPFKVLIPRCPPMILIEDLIEISIHRLIAAIVDIKL